MATYGLRIINDNSELLIDSDYLNPTFVQKLEFNSTPTSTETGIPTGSSIDNLHAGYAKSEYTTAIAPLNNGVYIVLWKLPDNGNIDVYYNFPTSVMESNKSLTCEVYASTSGTALSYTLPTAYIFATDPDSLSTLYSDGPALRMYNASNQKTFDSQFTQLIPYFISDNFFPPASTSYTPIAISKPTNAIFLLPKAYTIYEIDAINQYGKRSQVLFDTMYRFNGSTVYAKEISSFRNIITADSNVIFQYGPGTTGAKTLLVADGDLYQGAAGISVTTTNPTYTLSSNLNPVNETNNTTFTITLTTINVTNNTPVYYTVTGINAADLSFGSLQGSFVIQNNAATASFTVATDNITEGAETFLLSLNGINQSVSVNILDTSRSTPVWTAVSAASVNEGSLIYADFNALYNDSIYPVTFEVVGISEVEFAYPDITLSPSIPLGAGYTRVTINARADLRPEGPESFQVKATVDGASYYTSTITINDTTTSSVSAASNWIVGTDNTVTVTVTGGLGSTVYLYSNETSAIDVKPGNATSWYVNSNSFTVTTTYQAKALNPGTYANMGLYLKKGDEFLTFQYITTSRPAPAYSFGAVSSISESSTGSVQFNYSNSAGVSFEFSAISPSSGEQNDGSNDVTVNTTNFTVGSTYAAGSVSVSYSVAADQQTENSEYFRIQAYVNGAYYTSDDILISDTSRSPEYYLSVNNGPWNENTTQSTTVTLVNVAGYTYYPTSDNGSVTCQTSNFYVNSNSFTTTLYWDVGAVSADTTVTLYLRRNSSGGNIDAQASVTVRNILAAGTAIGGAYCLNYNVSPYTLRQVRADGSGGTYNDDINNSTTCGYVAPTARGIYHSQFCGTGADQYTLYFRYHDGNYGFYNEVHQTNSPTCGYVDPPVYAITSPLDINENNAEGRATFLHYNVVGSKTVIFSITSPSSGANGSPDVILVTTSLTVTGNNTPTIYYYTSPDNTTEGTEYFRIQASIDGSVVATSDNIVINDTSLYPASGTAIGGAYCLSYGSAPYTLRQVRANGSGGTYNDDTNNSPTCGYVAPTPRGTYLSQYCSVFSLYYRYADGNYGTYDVLQANNSPTCGYNPPAYGTYLSQYCSVFSLYYRYADGAYGSYDVLQANNSTSCGYVEPSYSLGGTFSSLNNGAATGFYLYVTNPPAGDNVYVSASGPGAARVSYIDPAQFTTNTGTNVYYIYVYLTTPTSSVPDQSVTITVAHNNGAVSKSFSFTIPSYTVASAAPVVTSVVVQNGVYYAGESIDAVINFSGIITADTYIRIKLGPMRIYGTLYYPSSSGAAQSYAGGQYGDYIIMSIGTYSAYYAGPVNPGGFYPPITGVIVSAQAVTAGGGEIQSYVQSNTFTLDGGSN